MDRANMPINSRKTGVDSCTRRQTFFRKFLFRPLTALYEDPHRRHQGALAPGRRRPVPAPQHAGGPDRRRPPAGARGPGRPGPVRSRRGGGRARRLLRAPAGAGRAGAPAAVGSPVLGIRDAPVRGAPCPSRGAPGGGAVSRGERFDVVHAEQLQALAADGSGRRRAAFPWCCAPRTWRATSGRRPPGARRGLAGERCSPSRRGGWRAGRARRCGGCAAVLALTAEDAARLRALARGRGSVRVVRAAVPGSAGRGRTAAPRRAGGRGAGEPGAGCPTRTRWRWFLAEVWPLVRARCPARSSTCSAPRRPVRSRPASTVHPPPRDSAEAFAPGSILAVPLRIGSGVRIKVLEAWARGVPVVGTPAALAGLEAEDGREAAGGGRPRSLRARLSARLASRARASPARLVEAGRRARRERHDPRAVAAELLRPTGRWRCALGDGSRGSAAAASRLPGRARLGRVGARRGRSGRALPRPGRRRAARPASSQMQRAQFSRIAWRDCARPAARWCPRRGSSRSRSSHLSVKAASPTASTSSRISTSGTQAVAIEKPSRASMPDE